MNTTGPTTTIKIFSDREFDDIVIENARLAPARASIERMIAGNPAMTLAIACMTVIHRAVFAHDLGVEVFGKAAVLDNLSCAVMVFASQCEKDFQPEKPNFILIEAWPQSMGCAVYRDEWVAAFRKDVVLAREHFAATGGLIPLPQRQPQTIH